MRFKTTLLITLCFNLFIVALDKGSGLVICWLLADKPNEKGGLDLLTTLPFILMAVSNLGLATSLVYYTRRDEVSTQTAGETTGAVALLWGFLIAGLALATIQLWYWFDPGTEPAPFGLLIPIVAATPFMLWISYRNSIQLVLQQIRAYNTVHLLPSLAYLPVFLLFYFVLTEKNSYMAGVYARFLPAVGLAVVVTCMLRRYVPLLPRLDLPFLKKAVTYGWRANLNSTLTYLNHRLDLYVLWLVFIPAGAISHQHGKDLIKEEVAYYSLAVTLAELIWYFPDTMRDLLFSKVAGLSREEAREFTPVVSRNSLMICLAGAALIWFLYDPLLGFVMGESWERLWSAKVGTALAWLLPGTVLFTVAKVLQADLAAQGRINSCVVLCAQVFIVMLAGDFLLAPSGGARGASIASTIAYAAAALMTLLVYARRSGVALRDLVVPRYEDLAHYRAACQLLPFFKKDRGS